MLTNTIIWNDSQLHPPTFKHLRRVLKMMVEARKQIGLSGRGWGISPAESYTSSFIILGEPTWLEARVDISYL